MKYAEGERATETSERGTGPNSTYTSALELLLSPQIWLIRNIEPFSLDEHVCDVQDLKKFGISFQIIPRLSATRPVTGDWNSEREVNPFSQNEHVCDAQVLENTEITIKKYFGAICN